MRKGAYKPGAYVSPPPSHRNHRQGRGGGGAGGSGGKKNGITLSKIFFGFVGLAARVAGQPMTCNSRYPSYVQSSDATLALFNNIAKGVTFTKVGASNIHETPLHPLPFRLIKIAISFPIRLQINVHPTDGVHSALQLDTVGMLVFFRPRFPLLLSSFFFFLFSLPTILLGIRRQYVGCCMRDCSRSCGFVCATPTHGCDVSDGLQNHVR